jgi:hypothetical protein
MPTLPPWAIDLIKKHGWGAAGVIVKSLNLDRLVQRRNALRRARATVDGAIAPLLLESRLRYVVFAGDRPVESFPPAKGDLTVLLADYNGYGKKRPDDLIGLRIRKRFAAVGERRASGAENVTDTTDGADKSASAPDPSAFKAMADELPALLDELTAAEPSRAGDHLEHASTPGVYLLSEGPVPMYVGQTRNMRQRLRLHTAPNSRENQASFAFRLAQATADQEALSVNGTRKERAADPAFAELFRAARERVADMEVRTILMDDPVQRTVFEVFVAQALNLVHNDFETH